jgi:hypothetical protein
VVFSTLFFCIHASGFYNSKVIVDNSSQLPWLYSSLMTLFSILAGFIIQKQWENWDDLVDAVKDEVDSLRELFLWSRYLPEEYKKRFGDGIKYYLKEMIDGGLVKSEEGEKSKKIEQAFSGLQDTIFQMSHKDQQYTATTFSFFSKIMESRTNRLRYGFHHIKRALKNTLFFCMFLVMLLCLFIGIQDVWIDYGFTLSLSLIVYAIYTLIDDLDNPIIPGSWHLTTEDYESLLKQIETVTV